MAAAAAAPPDGPGEMLNPEELYDAGEGFLVPQYYRSLEPIGGGAYGLVMKAQVEEVDGDADAISPPPDLPTNVAIKRISSAIVYKDPYRAKQTYREIVLLKQLRHENLIRMVDMFVSGGSDARPGDVYIVSEVMDCDLGALINSPWGCPYELQGEHIQYILYQVIRGLKYIHSAEVLHRDLKPQNILVNSNLDVRICDFGLARTNHDFDGSATGYVTTMWYRAPEVMLTWQHYNSALDMWSVGCIFAEMINRLNRNVSREIDDRRSYAVFPADSHVEHLSMILNLIGPPPEEVLDRSSGSTKSWVQSQMDELGEVPELHVGLGCDDPMAVSLLGSLLAFDSEQRLTAAEALDHLYLRDFRDASTDPFDTRGKLHMQFDTTDSSWAPEFWRELIETEILEVAAELRGGAPEVGGGRPASVHTMDLSDLDQVFTEAPIDQYAAASDLLTSQLEMEEDETLRAAFGEVASLMELGSLGSL